jgi:hypothetical protein
MDSASIDAPNHFYRELHQLNYYKSRITHHQDKSKNTTMLRDIFYLTHIDNNAIIRFRFVIY